MEKILPRIIFTIILLTGLALAQTLSDIERYRKQYEDYLRSMQQGQTGFKLSEDQAIIGDIPSEFYVIKKEKDIKPDAIKIGMLHSSSIIKSVISSINKIKVKKIILDPVMVAKGGTKLINNKAIQILKSKLIKKVILITPNIPEAEILTKNKIKSVDDMIYAGKILLNLGAQNVLVKGGHLNTRIVQDVFVSKNEIKVFKNKKITTKNTHGTGCTLSSAITTFFSCGKPLKKSCELGIKYVSNAIGSKLNYGKGHGPINHLNSIIVNKKFK